MESEVPELGKVADLGRNAAGQLVVVKLQIRQAGEVADLGGDAAV